MSRLNCRKCNQSQITESVQPIAAFAPPAQFVSVAYVVLNISILDVREMPSAFASSSTKTEKNMMHVAVWRYFQDSDVCQTFKMLLTDCPAATCCLRSQSFPRLLYVVPDPIYTPPDRMSHRHVKHSTLATLLANSQVLSICVLLHKPACNVCFTFLWK